MHTDEHYEPDHFPDKVITKTGLPDQIKKGHELVFSYQDLSKRQADVFALMMASMHEDDWSKGSPVYEFTTTQISDFLDIDKRSVRSIIKPVCNELTKKNIGLENGSNFEFYPIFSRIRYEGGVLKMKPNPELRAAYIDYKKGYALINTKNYFGLDKEYTKRLYEMLSRFKNHGTIHPIAINALKGMFGILDEKGEYKSDKRSYKATAVFINRCIKQPMEEMRNNLVVSKEMVFPDSATKKGAYGFELIKRGKTITHIKFTVKWVSKSSETSIELNQKDALERIKEIEGRRFTLKLRDEKLSIKELEMLKYCYETVGAIDKASLISIAIEKRNEELNEEENFEDLVTEELAKLQGMAEQLGVDSGDY
ncbi:replication initiation protein [Pseudoalteromonas sp. T1lg23B]|uniref:replication initiation protein n=1 Tax=Pseudoalteromonas sp. T1lg23B TaxID=2077097 RepID=UPI00131A3380|nr:replication initiation protein [Pseudoalteromonas sp. T1lg23B]